MLKAQMQAPQPSFSPVIDANSARIAELKRQGYLETRPSEAVVRQRTPTGDTRITETAPHVLSWMHKIQVVMTGILRWLPVHSQQHS